MKLLNHGIKMVTRSVDDYKQWKKDVRQHYINLFPTKEKYINAFMDYISKVYDPIGRVFIPYKVMWYLYERLKRTKKNQHFWIAFMGKLGGEGKSTLAKHILHFLDPEFTSDTRVAMNFDEYIEIVYQTKKVQGCKYPAVLMDEPDIKTHSLSKKARDVRNIMGKQRQLNLFIGVCGNSLADIPNFVLHRLSAICYLNEKHRFWLWDQLKDKGKHNIIEDIKKEWKLEGHSVFTNPKITKRCVFKNLKFSPELPFKEKDYEEIKNKDVYNDLDGYRKVNLGVGGTGSPPVDKKSIILQLIINNSKLPEEERLTTGKMIKMCACSKQYYHELRKLAFDRLSEPKNNTNVADEKIKVPLTIS